MRAPRRGNCIYNGWNIGGDSKARTWTATRTLGGKLVTLTDSTWRALEDRIMCYPAQYGALAPVYAAAPVILAALVRARDALVDLNQSENDNGALLAEIDAAINASEG